MSDFGASILIYKDDETAFNENEIKNILGLLPDISKKKYTDVFGDPFLFELSEIVDEENVLFLLLSDYDYEPDEDPSETFEIARKNDEKQMIEIVQKIEQELGEIYSVESDFEEW